MKIFIAGAGGYLGSAVTKELADRGHKVTGLVLTDKEKSIKQKGVNYIIGDLLGSGEWCDKIREADKVISLLSPLDISEKIPREKVEAYSRKHTEEVANLIKAAADGKATTVIATFHTDCYGNRHGQWATEADAVDPIGYCRPIEGSLKVVEELAEETGLNVIRVFPGMVYGNGGWFKELVQNLKAGKAKLVEPGDNYLNLIHIDDLAGLYGEIVEKVNNSDVFTLTDDRPVTQKDLLGQITALMGLPMPKMVDFKTYAREFGVLQAESMSSSTRVPGIRIIDMFNYPLKARSYELGVLMTLHSMGEEVSEEAVEKLQAA